MHISRKRDASTLLRLMLMLAGSGCYLNTHFLYLHDLRIFSTFHAWLQELEQWAERFIFINRVRPQGLSPKLLVRKASNWANWQISCLFLEMDPCRDQRAEPQECWEKMSLMSLTCLDPLPAHEDEERWMPWIQQWTLPSHISQWGPDRAVLALEIPIPLTVWDGGPTQIQSVSTLKPTSSTWFMSSSSLTP